MTAKISPPPPASAPPSSAACLVISVVREPNFTYTVSGLDLLALLDVVSSLRADAARLREYLDVHAEVCTARYFTARADSVQVVADQIDACLRALSAPAHEEVP